MSSTNNVLFVGIEKIEAATSDNLILRADNTRICKVESGDDAIYALSYFSHFTSETEVAAVRAPNLVTAISKWEVTRWIAETLFREAGLRDLANDNEVFSRAEILCDGSDSAIGFVRLG